MEQIIKNQEFKEKLAQVINESGLPAFIMKSTLKELFEQVIILEQQQYEQALNTVNEKEKEKKHGKN